MYYDNVRRQLPGRCEHEVQLLEVHERVAPAAGSMDIYTMVIGLQREAAGHLDAPICQNRRAGRGRGTGSCYQNWSWVWAH